MSNAKETLLYNDYIVKGSNLRYSNFIKNLMIQDSSIEKFSCPRCGKIYESIEHGMRIRCYVCNLSMQRFGNALEIWE